MSEIENLLKFANNASEICNNSGKLIKVPIPRIIVIGTQSSGKSKLLSRIIGIKNDIFPTGEGMTTRTPLHVRMHHVIDERITIFLSYQKDEKLEIIKEIQFLPNSEDEIIKIQELKQEIITLTDKITGGKFLISKTPIFIDIKSNSVTNFSFVDLPGLTATHLSDKGQSENLPTNIKELLKNELVISNTIALVVVKSGFDLETDLGIALINEVRQSNPNIQLNTIGVLTKPDLLNEEVRTNLNNIVSGKLNDNGESLSKNVMMNEGFFIVNNLCQTLEHEYRYFLNKFDNSREIINDKRYGIIYLQNHLQNILVKSVKMLIPQIKTNLIEIKNSLVKKIKLFGTILDSDDEKFNYYIMTTSEFTRLIIKAVTESGTTSGNNISQKIKQVKDNFLIKINSLTPFSETELSDEYICEIISSFEGVHMTAHASIEQFVEKCVNDEKRTPIMFIKPVADEYINGVIKVLNDAVVNISKSDNLIGLSMYQKLRTIMCNTIISKIKEYGLIAISKIIEYLQIQQGFFWSTDEEFLKILREHYYPKTIEEEKKSEVKQIFSSSSAIKTVYIQAMQSKNNMFYTHDPEQVRILAIIYYQTIIANSRDYIIKIVMNVIVGKLIKDIGPELNTLLGTKNSDILKSIVEDSCITKERQELNNRIINLENVISMTSFHET